MHTYIQYCILFI